MELSEAREVVNKWADEKALITNYTREEIAKLLAREVTKAERRRSTTDSR